MTEKEKELASQIFGQQQEQSRGFLGAIKDAIQSIMPGLSMEKIASDLGKEVTHQVGMGAHEISAAIFNNSAFVMYPRGSKDDHMQEQGKDVQQPEHGVHGPEQQRDQPHLERGGRSM